MFGRRRRRVPTTSGYNWGAFFMPTKLFDTVVAYNTPADPTLTLVARQLHVVDLNLIATPVLADFPAGTVVGECIGITISATGGTANTVSMGTGSAEFGFVLQNLEECVLWTWNGASWDLVSKYLDPAALPFYIETFTNGQLAAGAKTITHDLGTNFPLVDVYDDAGNLIPSDGLHYTVVRIDQNSFTLTIAAALLPISGSWGVSVGF